MSCVLAAALLTACAASPSDQGDGTTPAGIALANPEIRTEPLPDFDPVPLFPDGGTTGVPDGVRLTPSGSLVITEDDTLVSGLQVRGAIIVRADDVTIRNTLVQDSSRYPIHVERGATNTTIEHTEVESVGGKGICIFIEGSGTTVRAANVHSGEDGIRIEADEASVEDSFVHGLSRVEGGHHDSIQIRRGDDVTIRGNNLQAYVPQTDDPLNAAIQIGTLIGDDQISNLLVEGNLMNGGNFTINGGGQDEVDSARYRENRFGPDSRYGAVGNLQNSTWDTSNVWHDTGEPVDH